MVFTSIPLYHLDNQANWHQHQQTNEHHQQQQQLILQTQHDQQIVSPQQPEPTPPSQNGVGGGVGSGGSLTGSIKPNSMVDRARQAQLPLPEAGLKCPRCESTNTKFCYFNNYNLSQPRHFCKTCRRYWTRGGSLRNVPVGGASRRTAKRSKARPGGTATVSVTSGGTRSSLVISNSQGGGNTLNSNQNNNNSCSTSLFLSHNLPQLPFLPSLHHFGNTNPSNNIGLNLLGHGGAEMEFPNLLASFEGLGRMGGNNNNSGMMHHSFENSSLGHLIGHSLHQSRQSANMDHHHHDIIIDRMTSPKIEDPRGLNLAKEFALLQGNNNHNDQQQYSWNNNNNSNNNSVWSNGSGDLSSFASPSNGHLLG